MERPTPPIAELLRTYQAGPGAYGEPVVKAQSAGADLFVLSDLHVGEGRGADSAYARSEKFFADESFKRLLDHIRSDLADRRGILVLNGDVFDFLRVTRIPAPDQLGQWRDDLGEIGIHLSIEELARTDSKEREYG